MTADSNNDIDGALSHLAPPMDYWVDDPGPRSLEQLRDDIGGDKSDNTTLEFAQTPTLVSGPESSGLGGWTATVTYQLRATGSFVSETGEEKCIDNVQTFVDVILGTPDGDALIKSHKKEGVPVNRC